MVSGKRFLKYSILFLALGLIFLFIAYLFTIPSTAWLNHKAPELTSLMKYRLKNAQRGYHIKKRWVPLSEISPYLIKAVLIAEDDRFYMHEGFDIEGIKEAIRKDLKKGKFVAGGSTITQQLARNLFLTPEKTLTRKFKEAIITWKLEKTLSKKRILELYLNVVEWGPGVFGAEAAANHYYGKSAKELTPEEAARLAVILPNPLRYNPLNGSRYVENRAAFVLEIMKKRGIISPEYGLEKDLHELPEEDLINPQGEKEAEEKEE